MFIVSYINIDIYHYIYYFVCVFLYNFVFSILAGY